MTRTGTAQGGLLSPKNQKHKMKTNRIILASAVAVCLVMVAVVLVELVGPFQPPQYKYGYRLYIWFDNVQNLRVHDRVRISGVEVGFVEGIFLNETNGKVRVTMKMSNRVAVKTDSVATIKPTGIARQHFIELKVGSPNAARALEGTYLFTGQEPAPAN
jgi:ABC-type transporter Mla subunit MlaD